MKLSKIPQNERKMYDCGNLLQVQKMQLKTIRKDIEDPKIAYKRLCHRIDGMITINEIVHDMLIEIDDSGGYRSKKNK